MRHTRFTESSGAPAETRNSRRTIEDRFSDRVYFRIVPDENGRYVWRELSPAAPWLEHAGILHGAEVLHQVYHEDRPALRRIIERLSSGVDTRTRTSIRLYVKQDRVLTAHVGLTYHNGELVGYLEPEDGDERFGPNYRLREILEQSSVAYTLLDADYVILDFNARSDRYAQQVFGRPMRCGDSIMSFATEDSIELITRDLAKAFAGEAVRYEWEYEVDGYPFHFYFVHVPFPDGDGVVREVAMLTLDLSEQRRVERSNRELLTAIDKSPISVLITRSDGTIRYVNPFFEELTGYTADEVIGKNPRMLQAGDADRAAYADLWEKLRSGEPWYGEFHNRKKNGEEYYERAILVPLRDRSGHLDSVVGIKQDVTDYRRTIDELRESEQRLYRLFNNAGDAIYVHDTAGTIQQVNDAACRQTGYSKAELIGMHIGEIDAVGGHEPPAKLVELLDGRARGDDGPSHVRFESLNRRKDGSTFPVSVVIFPFSTAAETLIAASATDMSEAKRKEAQIIDSLAEKEVLLRELHHRVKNNLQSVASLIKLQEEDVRDEHDREVFRKNEDRIRAMATVHQMLYETDDLSRIDIANYMREVAAYTSYDAVARGVPVDVVVNADPVEIEIDRAVPLGLAVQELIRNAVKHSCSGGQRGRVELTLRRRCGGIEVTISDSGEGDATEFFQEHRRGLGTQLVNLLCDQIGGTVTPLRGPGGRIRVYVPGKP